MINLLIISYLSNNRVNNSLSNFYICIYLVVKKSFKENMIYIYRKTFSILIIVTSVSHMDDDIVNHYTNNALVHQ